MAAPFNLPTALNLLTAVKVQFMDAYSQAYLLPAYSDYLKFIYQDDPRGDLIYTIYAEPMKPLRQWYGDRPMSSADMRYWTQSIRTFGDGLELDVDDLKDDANPAKRMMYMLTAQKFAESAAGWVPSMVAEAMINGINRVWLPDNQNILSIHNYNPGNASLGTFRNYYANNVQGGSAAYPLTYGNLLSALKNGLSFKAPTGLDYPVQYTHLVVPPSSVNTARRLVGFERLPAAEIFAQNTSSTGVGGDAINEVNRSYSLQVAQLANMPAGTWGLIDATLQSERPLAVKIRQPVTWQFVGPSTNTMDGMPVSDEGGISEMQFNRNKTKYGPKARGEAYFRNWWRVAFFDGNASPITTLSIVS